MKIIKNHILTLLLLILCSFQLQAQQELKGTKQKLDITVDEMGNANLSITTKYNASQWDIFKKTVGSNQAYLKRMMIKAMPKYFLTDFEYEEQPMDRSYTFKMKAFAVTQPDENGKWEAELDMKDPDITKLNDHTFTMNLNMINNGMLIEQEQKINLPPKAKNAKLEKNSFGSAVLTYQLKTGSSTPYLTFLGILMILLGAGMLLVNLRKQNQNDKNQSEFY